MQSLLALDQVSVSYGQKNIVQNVSLTVAPGEILGIVGESGSGKSTLLRAIMGLLDENGRLSGGSIFFEGQDLSLLSKEKLRRLRGAKMSMIFQHPSASLCPVKTIQSQFYQVIRNHEKMDKVKADDQIGRLLEKLNLRNKDRILKSYPFELSGGMNQRVSIALSMILHPSLLLADEPTSALDVTVQAQTVKEMMKLRDTFGTSIVIVTHNMGVVSFMVDKIAVMYAGRLVEYGWKEDVLLHPRHPYTQALMKAIPQIGGGDLLGIPGKPPAFGEHFLGCPFAPRCSCCTERCLSSAPAMKRVGEAHFSACFTNESKIEDSHHVCVGSNQFKKAIS